jgi:hypothetical protein
MIRGTRFAGRGFAAVRPEAAKARAQELGGAPV